MLKLLLLSQGFPLHLDDLVDCKAFRGGVAAHAIKSIAEDWVVTPAILGRSRGQLLDYQTVKWGWHCFARFGLGERTAANGPVTFQPNSGKVIVSGMASLDTKTLKPDVQDEANCDGRYR